MLFTYVSYFLEVERTNGRVRFRFYFVCFGAMFKVIDQGTLSAHDYKLKGDPLDMT